MELCTTELFIFVHSKLKPTMKKNKCYNVNVKFIRESEDIIAAACTCPARSSVKCFGKCSYAGAILFTLEVFKRKNLKTSVEPLRCTSQLSKWNVPHDTSSNFVPTDKTPVKTLNLENRKIIAMIHVHQMINILIMIV